MGAHVYVTLVGAGIAITAAAAYLIWVIKILWTVIDRLLTILRGVEGVTETTRPIGPVIDDINRDLDRSATALEACVQRLEERRQLASAEATRAPVHHGDGGAQSLYCHDGDRDAHSPCSHRAVRLDGGASAHRGGRWLGGRASARPAQFDSRPAQFDSHRAPQLGGRSGFARAPPPALVGALAAPCGCVLRPPALGCSLGWAGRRF